MALNLELYLNPLLRPPLPLAIVAAGLKYVATVVVLEDPVLVTREDYVSSRREDGKGAQCRRRIILVAQLLFYGLAVHSFVHDLNIMAQMSHLSLWERCHLLAMVLAFSPNTVAAVASSFTWGFRWAYLKDVPSAPSGLCMVSDVLAGLFSSVMGLFYMLPLMFISISYGALGLFSVCLVLFWDFLSLPWRIVDGDFGALWVAFPIACGLALCHLLTFIIIVAQVLFFKRRYPELARQSEQLVGLDTTAAILKKASAPFAVPALVIGSVRTLLAGCEANQEERELRLINVDLEARTSTDCVAKFVLSAGGGQMHAAVPAEERCILTDEAIALMTYSRITLCMLAPILQLTVVIAAKVFLGGSLWAASESTFGERSWSHYHQHIREAGSSAFVPLLWYYL